MEKYIAYYRVSTQRQGQSGLGLEAQKQAVYSAVGKENVLQEYIEIESGKKDNRDELEKALQTCKEKDVILIVAKLDRLSRSIKMLFSLRDSNVKFRALDLPAFNTLSLGIYATIAQHEREMISQRTKAALAAKKKQGWIAGTPANMTQAAREKGKKVLREKAIRHNSKAEKAIKDLLNAGLSLAKIADRLNQYGIKTSKGNAFTKSSVQNVIKLFSIKKGA
jgi:DNA invertase Pin-like site-specific DNA recombinase